MPPALQFWLPILVSIALAALPMHEKFRGAIRYGLWILAVIILTATITWQIATRTLTASPAPVVEAPQSGDSKDKEIAGLKQEINRLRFTRPPNLRIYFGDTEANGATFVVTVKDARFSLPSIRLANSGGSDAPPPRIRLFFSTPTENPEYGWESLKSTEKKFSSQFYLGGPQQVPPVGAGEIWVGPQFAGKLTNPTTPDTISARVNVFYGQEKPATATFTIVTQQ